MSDFLKDVFQTPLSLENYVKCVRNIKIGDKVFIYTRAVSFSRQPDRFFISRAPTSELRECIAIAVADLPDVKIDERLSLPRIILGTNSVCMGGRENWSEHIKYTIDRYGTRYSSYSPIAYVLVGKIQKRA